MFLKCMCMCVYCMQLFDRHVCVCVCGVGLGGLQVGIADEANRTSVQIKKAEKQRKSNDRRMR